VKRQQIIDAVVAVMGDHFDSPGDGWSRREYGEHIADALLAEQERSSSVPEKESE